MNHAHAAPAEGFINTVMRNDLTEQGERASEAASLPSGRNQV